MLVYNIHILDGLANGGTSKLHNSIKDENRNGKILTIKFNKNYQGAEMRSKYLKLALKCPGCTQVVMCLPSNSLGKISVASVTTQVYQFVIVVCFGTQVGTVLKLNAVAEDLIAVFEDAAAYIVLSRVQVFS